MIRRTAFCCAFVAGLLVPTAKAEVNPDSHGRVHSFEEIVSKIETANPDLQSARLEVDAQAALVEQAAMLPNPEVGVSLEGFGGSTDGADSSEGTVEVAQRIELGGKRSARVELERERLASRSLQASLERQRVLKEAMLRYATVIKLQREVEVLDSFIRHTAEALASVRRKVEVGGALAVQATPFEVQLATSKLERQQALVAIEQAKAALASLWQGASTEIGELVSLKVKSSSLLEQHFVIESSPAYVEAATQLAIAEKVSGLERALAVSDVTIIGGYRRLEETDDNALIAGISVPLPVFNRNQGKREAAALEQQATALRVRSQRTQIENEVRRLREGLRLVAEEQKVLAKELLPIAERSFKQTHEGYQLGRLSYLELDASHEALLELERRLVRVEYELLEAAVELSVLYGLDLEKMVSTDD
ncbi:MAG: TolC family protein [Bdellovibrionales bacterium]|nr:TolC family protein [Bdellovibrionales bacterium]